MMLLLALLIIMLDTLLLLWLLGALVKIFCIVQLLIVLRIAPNMK